MYRDNLTGEYPLHTYEVRERRRNISLPDIEWEQHILDEINVSFVEPSECPEYDPDFFACVEIDPIEYSLGKWKQQWKLQEIVKDVIE